MKGAYLKGRWSGLRRYESHIRIDLNCPFGRGAGAKDPPVGGCLLLHSICLPCVEPHPRGDDISNSSWRDGLLAFMEINTSTSQSRNTKFGPQLSHYLSPRVSCFFAISPPPQNSSPQLASVPRISFHPALQTTPTLQGMGTCVYGKSQRSTCFLLGQCIFCRDQASATTGVLALSFSSVEPSKCT